MGFVRRYKRVEHCLIYERVGQAFDHIRVRTVYTPEENKWMLVPLKEK